MKYLPQPREVSDVSLLMFLVVATQAVIITSRTTVDSLWTGAFWGLRSYT